MICYRSSSTSSDSAIDSIDITTPITTGCSTAQTNCAETPLQAHDTPVKNLFSDFTSPIRALEHSTPPRLDLEDRREHPPCNSDLSSVVAVAHFSVQDGLERSHSSPAPSLPLTETPIKPKCLAQGFGSPQEAEPGVEEGNTKDAAPAPSPTLPITPGMATVLEIEREGWTLPAVHVSLSPAIKKTPSVLASDTCPQPTKEISVLCQTATGISADGTASTDSIETEQRETAAESPQKPVAQTSASLDATSSAEQV